MVILNFQISQDGTQCKISYVYILEVKFVYVYAPIDSPHHFSTRTQLLYRLICVRLLYDFVDILQFTGVCGIERPAGLRHSRSSDGASRHFCFRAHTLTLSFNPQTTCARLLYLCGPSNNFII